MMLQSLLRPRPAADVRDQLVIAPHRPDRLGRPPARLGAIEDERFQQTLTWNVIADVAIETEYAVWTLMVADGAITRPKTSIESRISSTRVLGSPVLASMALG